MILIGSAALRYHYSDFPRKPNDMDYILQDGDRAMPLPGVVVEYHQNPIMANLYKTERACVMAPNDLYTLKASHLFWDINWNKHMFDFQFLKKKGCRLDIDLFYKLYEHWQTVHGKNNRSDLAMSATEFFDNALKEYDHDFLHTLIRKVPTYTKVLKDGAEVEVDEDKFQRLSEEEKEDLVREEVMVMSAERYDGLPYRERYSKMLKKFILNHAPMYEAIWIIENFVKLHKPKFDYISMMNEKLSKTKYPLIK